MTAVAKRKVRSYSLGMRQRLGLAGVLLGDPHTLILDEPANGLDPEGVRWIRDVLVALAREGRTILVSSHLLAEIALMADDLVVIGRGRLIEQGPVAPVHRPLRPALGARAHAAPGGVRRDPPPRRRALPPARSDGIDVQGLAIERIGELALQTQTVLHELSPQSESLEDAFLQATAGAQEYQSGGSLPPPPGPPPVGPPGGGR